MTVDDVVHDGDALVAAYYRHTAPELVQRRSAADLRAAVEAHVAVAATRPDGAAVVRVGTPTPAEDGYDAEGHVVVEIVCEDMPFLVDSVTAHLVRAGFGIDHVVHPQLDVLRDVVGTLVAVSPEEGEPPTPTVSTTLVRESWMHVELDQVADRSVLPGIEDGLRTVLRDVGATVADWDRMRTRARDLVGELRDDPPPVPAEEAEQAAELLAWLADGHFTFVGYREYDLVDVVDGSDGGEPVLVDGLRAVPGSGLGVLRDDPVGPPAPLPAAVRAKAREPELLILTKANTRSTVHRPVHLDYVGVKSFGPDGRVSGERRFLGLFTSAAYTESITQVPVLRAKAEAVLARLGFDRDSHSGTQLLDVLETYPRDELFSTPLDELVPIAQAVLHLQERRQLRVFLRPDAYGRYFSALVYLPRDRYTTAVRLRIEAILSSAVGGEPTVDFTARVTESVLARLHYVLRPTQDRGLTAVDVDALEQRLTDATRSWADDLARAVDDQLGEAATTSVLAAYGEAFPEAYKEDFGARTAVEDLRRVEALADDEISLELYAPPRESGRDGRLKLYRRGTPLSLSSVLPVFGSLGVEVVDERPYHLDRVGGQAWVYDFGLRAGVDVRPEALGLFDEAFLACWEGEAETDGFNRLVLAAGLTWRQVVVLRAYAKYLRQAATPFSQDYLEWALLDNTRIAVLLVELFEARFDPASGLADDPVRVARTEDVETRLAAALDEVASLDADRILRSFRTLLRATLRTNAYQRDAAGRLKPYLSFKLDPRSVPDLPQPRPRFEIFCYSPRVEGVHLRFGPVARGGLRWSDRREDFRTEVLGLVKAQMVKNTVIVPVGSKGGFYAKALPDPVLDRDAWMAEGVACYRTFICSLLDLTDDRDGDEILPPPDVVRHDGDDSYLVVAADKGTATFSDLANEVSLAYDYWLGDAFASGGSVGYDHKAMGITARGAWESVKRHFREMGVDCQREDFTCVGVGDMSGDVFGNGMLLSEHTRLVAAFDHRHVFLDPAPDAATADAERQRLYALPRSSWDDYDRSLISEGGGVYLRTAKSVPVSPQVRAALGLADDVTSLSPPQLLTAILTAPVDLLWNGGIGTYVKASSETHADVGDKANNAIRVDGADLRCRCVGEGGNLGLTQLGRIEYAAAGGRVTTDFIDNSAGVDTSDHEVNIKILLDQAVRGGGLSRQERDALLPTMTEEVAHLVLEDNVDQNLALANADAGAASLLHEHLAWMRRLEAGGHLDRAIEFLPTDAEVAQRRAEGRGLTEPELAVLMAYTKIVLAEELIGSDLPDESFFRAHLFSYFPTPVQHGYRAGMDAHPLRREIIVTTIVNELVNTAGMTFYPRLSAETGASAAQLARAHAVAAEIYGAAGLYAEIAELDHRVPAEVQTRMRLEVRTLTERVTRWLVVHSHVLEQTGAEETVDHFGTDVQRILHDLPRLVVGGEAERMAERAERLEAAGVPDDVAERTAALGPALAALGFAVNARRRGVAPTEVAAVHFELGERLGVDGLLTLVQALPREDRWQTQARSALRDELQSAHHELTARVLDATEQGTPAERVTVWLEAHAAAFERTGRILSDVLAEDEVDLARLSVGVRIVRSLLT